MNLKTIIVWVATGLTALGATDDEIRSVVWRTSQAFDNPRRNESGLQHALVMSEYDTNRFTHILQEIALSGTGRVERAMIQHIGRFGNASNLPFLYSCVTNSAYADLAIVSLFKIEGVTTNSVNKLNEFFLLTRDDPSLCGSCCSQVLCGEMVARASLTNREYLLNSVRNFAMSTNRCVYVLDQSLRRADPGYAHSRRRLAVLTASTNYWLSGFQRNYVTNAINELIAYPEANLND